MVNGAVVSVEGGSLAYRRVGSGEQTVPVQSYISRAGDSTRSGGAQLALLNPRVVSAVLPTRQSETVSSLLARPAAELS